MTDKKHPKPSDPKPDPFDTALQEQEIEWIKYAQQSQRELGQKYDETAKALVGLFAGIFGAFTLLLTFFGLPGSVDIDNLYAMVTILFFAGSIICMVIVIAPRDLIPSSNGMQYDNALEIWKKIAKGNRQDHIVLSVGVGLFIIGIILIPVAIALNVTSPGDTVRIVAPADKILSLQNASISFEANSTLSEEMHLLRKDEKTYTFLLANGNTVTVSSDFVQAVVARS